MLEEARAAYESRLAAISQVQCAVRLQLEALKRGEYELAFDDDVLDPFMAGDERQGPGRAESEQACDSGAVGQSVGVRSSKLSDALAWIAQSVTSPFEEATGEPPQPGTLQAWRARVSDRAQELSERLQALDALEKIRRRELEQLILAEGGAEAAGEGRGEAASPSRGADEAAAAPAPRDHIRVWGGSEFWLPKAPLITDEAIRAQVDALTKVWYTAQGAWSIIDTNRKAQQQRQRSSTEESPSEGGSRAGQAQVACTPEEAEASSLEAPSKSGDESGDTSLTPGHMVAHAVEGHEFGEHG